MTSLVDQKSPQHRAPVFVRLLASLPGPWWLWTIAVVALYPLLRVSVSSGCRRSTGTVADVLLIASCALGGAATMWAWRRIEALRPLVARLTADAGEDPFRGADSTLWPLVLALAAPVPYLIAIPSSCPAGPTLRLYAGSFFAVLPLTNAFWMYLVVALGLHRLGARPLRLDSFERDRSLGLRPLGQLAFGFYLVYATITAVLTLFASSGRIQLVTNLAYATVGLAMFFVEMRGLRRQMLAGKAAHAAWARDLYAAAIESLRRDPSPEAVDRQAHRVLAVAEIKREVAAIQEWPADDGVVRTAVAVGTSIMAAILARFIMGRVGL